MQNIDIPLSNPVASGATFTGSYPTGKSRTNYIAAGAILIVGQNQYNNPTVSLGTSTITITNPTGATIASGTKVRLSLKSPQENAGLTVPSLATYAAHVEYPGSPFGNLTPDFVGQECQDTTTGIFYKAQGASSAAWARYARFVVGNRRQFASVGKKVASWTALQNSAGTAALVAGDLPTLSDNATQALKLTQNGTASFGQQGTPDGGQSYMPLATSTGFTAGVWVKNPNTRTLNFELRFYNDAANHNIAFNGACEAGGWTFITFSPSQQLSSGWVLGTDMIKFIRCTQLDSGPEGAWTSGEYLLFGPVYVDLKARPRFLICFDDGNAEQSRNNPSATAIVSGSAAVTSTATNVCTTGATHNLPIGAPIMFTDTAPTSLAVSTVYYVKTTPASNQFTLATDSTLATTATTTGFSGTANWQYAGTQQRSGQGIVEEYGFRGTVFIVPSWLGTTGRYGYGGTSNKFMSSADVQQMYGEGWSVGSHSNTHPSNNDNAGLRLLGPYGYFLSNTVDNLSAKYVAAWSLGASNRRRATGAATGTNVITFENAHKFLINMPIVFTDVAPTGLTVGVTYYVQTIPLSTTCTLATDQGTLASTATITSTWSGVANYRYPGSANDDSAIYADIIAGAAGVAALGIPTGSKFFALPQGGADEYVRSACIRAGLTWIRGVSSYNNAHTIPVGYPSGGGMSNINNYCGGWMQQLDAVQSDGTTITVPNLQTYINDTVTQGACGCSYHHGVGAKNIPLLDQMCAYLKTKSDARLIDVVTADDMAAAIGI